MTNSALPAWMLIAASIAFAAAPSPSERDALRRIVQEQCVPGLRLHGTPAPCEEVVLPAGNAVNDGFGILHDRKGGAHFLLIPTRTIAGIESAELLDPVTPDYIAAAWQHRHILDRWLHQPVPREAAGLAINPRTARGQDQFHIHIECVSTTLDQALDQLAGSVDNAWSSVTVAGRRFLGRRIMGDEVLQSNAFRSWRTDGADIAGDPGNDTFIIAGRTFADGPGVIVLVGTGRPGGETLLDGTCSMLSSDSRR